MRNRTRSLEEKVSLYSRHVPVLVITGARQAGTSTRLEPLFSESHPVIVLDHPIDVGNARLEPELFLKKNPGPFTLDEILESPPSFHMD